MLSKLLKQEFRATGRIMLPVLAALLLLSVLGNFSIRMMDQNVTNNAVLRFLFVFLIIVFVLGMFAAVLMTLLLMITRFYRNLLKDEGYLMHTLPVSVHGLVWSKLIVSLVWFVVTGLVVTAILFLTGLIQSGTNLGELMMEFPSWAEIREAMAEAGFRGSDITVFLLELLALALVGFFATCLHFYAAMAMGHMFNKDKILLSIVFFVLLSFAMSFFTSFSGVHFFRDIDMIADTMTGKLAVSMVQRGLLYAILLEGVQAAVLYFATTLSLRRGLNLG